MIFQGAPCGDGRLLVELYPGSHGGTEHHYMIIFYIFYLYYIPIIYNTGAEHDGGGGKPMEKTCPAPQTKIPSRLLARAPGG